MLSIFKIVRDFLMDKSYRRLLVSALIVLIIGTVVYHYVEYWSWFDSFYFSVITLTTIGYGDFYPVSVLGKVFTIFYILIGVGIIFGFINAFYEHRVIKYKEIRRAKGERESSM
jgi:voltage-gated potassium channel